MATIVRYLRAPGPLKHLKAAGRLNPLKTIAWISHSSQMAENYGGDTNVPTNAIKQAVPITTILGK